MIMHQHTKFRILGLITFLFFVGGTIYNWHLLLTQGKYYLKLSGLGPTDLRRVRDDFPAPAAHRWRHTSMSIRAVRQIVQATPTMEGAGVKLHRGFGFGDTTEFDPFLLFDDFRNDRPADFLKGFPWHPHRGIETITYVLSGTVEHGDSLGNSGTLGSGDIQWMTAGAASFIRRCRKETRRAACTAFSSGRTCRHR